MGIVDRVIMVVHSISNVIAAFAVFMALSFASDAFDYSKSKYEAIEPTVTKVAGNIDSGVKLMKEGIAVGKEGVQVIREKRLWTKEGNQE